MKSIKIIIENDDGTTSVVATCTAISDKPTMPWCIDSMPEVLAAMPLNHAFALWGLCRAMCTSYIPMRPGELETAVDLSLLHERRERSQDAENLARLLFIAHQCGKTMSASATLDDTDMRLWSTLADEVKAQWRTAAEVIVARRNRCFTPHL